MPRCLVQCDIFLFVIIGEIILTIQYSSVYCNLHHFNLKMHLNYEDLNSLNLAHSSCPPLMGNIGF